MQSLDDVLGNPNSWNQPQQQPQASNQQQSLEDYLGSQSQIPQAPQMPQSFGQNLMQNYVMPTAQGINDMFGPISQGLAKGVSGVINAPSALLRAAGVNAPDVAKLPQNSYAQMAMSPGVMDSTSGKLAELIASLGAPGGVAAKATKGIEGFKGANALRNIAMGGLGGYLGDEDNRGGAALGGAALGGLGSAAGGLLKGAKYLKNIRQVPQNALESQSTNLVDMLASGGVPKSTSVTQDILSDVKSKLPFMSGQSKAALANPNAAVQSKLDAIDELNGQATNSLNAMVKGKDFKDLNSLNAAKLRQNYLDQQNISRGKYNNFKDLARQAGYENTVKPRLSLEDYQKLQQSKNISDVNPSFSGKTVQFENNDKTWGGINKILNSSDNLVTQSVGKDTLDALQKLKLNPSPQMLHDVQSQIGKRLQSLKRLPVKSNSDNAAIYQLNELHPQLKKGIEHTLEKNGDVGVLSAYKDAQQHFKSNVIPYQKSPMKSMFKPDGTTPADVTTALSKDDPSGYMDAIRSHVMSSPELRNSLLAQQLVKGSTADLGSTTRNINFGAMKNTVDKMPNVLRRLNTPEAENALKGLLDKQDMLQKMGLVGKYGKYGLSGIGGLGGLTGGVYEFLKHI